MNEISKWVLSICGVIILGVLIDAVLPDGGTRKFIKGVFAVILLYVIISPLPGFFKSGFGFKFDPGDIPIEGGLVETTYKQKVRLLERSTEEKLAGLGFSGVNVGIYVDKYDENMKILGVSCNIFSLDDSKKSKIKEIAAIVAEFLNINEGSVTVYG